LTTAVVLWLPRLSTHRLRVHGFAPVLLFRIVLMVMVTLLPDDSHLTAVARIGASERGIGIVAFLLLGLIAYWVLPPLYRLS
jgi:hypothetical protein